MAILPTMRPGRRYTIDPDDPRAPPQELWDRLDDGERRYVIDNLPSEFPVDEARPPEGDEHQQRVQSTREALRGYFRRLRKRIYIGSDLPVYYPGERMFSVDALAVLDVDDHPRNSWIVSAEGKGLDMALEIHWLGHRKKDFERNVEWFPRLGIREYFVFDARKATLRGFRLEAPRVQHYVELVPQDGRFTSDILGLDLAIEGAQLRFYAGSAALPDAQELIGRLNAALEQTQRRAEEESKRADETERRLSAALAELERLKHEIGR